MRRAIVLVTALLAIGLAAGFVGWYFYQPTCSIHGVVTSEGQPLKWKADDDVLVVLYVPLDRTNDLNVYRAYETDRNAGTYVINGIPAGKYRVAVQQQDATGLHDRLGFAFSTADSPIFMDVTRDGEQLDINLPKAAPRKKK